MADKPQGNSAREITWKDIEEALKRFDFEAHFRRVDEAIAPQIEALRIARLRSYAQGRYHVYV
jgi:hypothetical protein